MFSLLTTYNPILDAIPHLALRRTKSIHKGFQIFNIVFLNENIEMKFIDVDINRYLSIFIYLLC